MTRAAVILAAGMGTRMKSAKPKVMRAVAGLPILGHVIAAARGAGVARIVVVTAPDADEVRAYAVSLGAQTVIQDKQLGTGHAAAAAGPALADFDGEVVICYGDMPLMTAKTLDASFEARRKAGLAIVAFHSKSTAYGRVIAGKDGLLDRIVEYRDANDEERKVDLCNAGIMAADAKSFFRWASRLESNNAQKEYYLTDVPKFAKADGQGCAIAVADEGEMIRVNSRAELADAEAVMQARLRNAALANGVGMIAVPGDRVPLTRHGSGSRRADRSLCGVRTRRRGARWRGDQKSFGARRRGGESGRCCRGQHFASGCVPVP